MERLGFIGLGIMGKPMAANLLAAGFPLCVHNRSPAAVQELAAGGATAAESALDLAAASDIVITMLPDSPDVEQVVLGTAGVAAGMRPGTVFIDMSTIAPATTRRIAATLADRGIDAIDAPVSGGQAAAQAGSLSIMAGGSEAALVRAQPIFDVVGRATTHIGSAGAGQVAKAANQIVVALTIQAVAEALMLSRKAGVDPARVRDALLGGFAQSRVLEIHGQRILEGSHEPGSKLRLHRKDLAIALQLGLSLPAAVGLGFAFVPVTIAAVTGTEPHQAGLASGLINTSQQVGGALGLAILATIANSRTQNLFHTGVHSTAVALTKGFDRAFLIGAGFAILGAILTVLLISSKDSREHARAARIGEAGGADAAAVPALAG